MNYRHAFHAGNFADVVKHATLARLLEYLKRKPAAFRVLDTHAGIGLYDLYGERAEKTGEWQDGIGRLMGKDLPARVDDLLAPYLDAVRAQNPDGALRFYPGSPFITRHLLREQDRMFALELHPEDSKALAENFAGDFQVRVTHLDGWQSLGAYLPPKEKRGLVLVDPPFEEKGEFARLVDGLKRAHQKFPGGLYALWYPVKDLGEVEKFIADLKATGIRKILRTEVSIRPPSEPPRLHGTGMIVVNPPFTLEQELGVLLPALAEILSDEARGRHRLEWIAGE